ncbi:MAG TPA: GNAT family N-acetyltransferase [Devosia sp.]|nr:GNAT family N-acetyltransferase [Devosia sp.]
MSELNLIESERLVLSGWTMDQVDDLVRLHGDPAVTRYLEGDGAPWDRAKCTARVALWCNNFGSTRMGKLRVRRKSDGVLVGRAGFGLHGERSEPEIGYAMFPEHHGKGYATEAANALRDWIFRETDWMYFLGFADVRNAPSLAVLTKIGMVRTHVAELRGRSVQFHIMHKGQLAA